MRTNVEWLHELRARGTEQAGALADLRRYLLRAARHALYRSRARLAHLARADGHDCDDWLRAERALSDAKSQTAADAPS
jgi:hypothetical protein